MSDKSTVHYKSPSYYAILTCDGDSTGYSQLNRKDITIELINAGAAEADCSSAVNWWLFMGGYLDELVWFWTAIEREYLKGQGFTEYNINYGVEPMENDVLWRPGHTALYIGDGLIAELIHTENYDAGYNGSIPGDQTGDESRIVPYIETEWSYILRKENVKNEEILMEENIMWFTFHINGDKRRPMQFCDGTKVHPIANLDELGELRKVYKWLTGEDLPHNDNISEDFVALMQRT